MACGPGISWVQKLGGDTSAGFGNRKVECLIGLVFNLCKFSRVDGIKDGTCIFQSISLALL